MNIIVKYLLNSLDAEHVLVLLSASVRVARWQTTATGARGLVKADRWHEDRTVELRRVAFRRLRPIAVAVIETVGTAEAPAVRVSRRVVEREHLAL